MKFRHVLLGLQQRFTRLREFLGTERGRTVKKYVGTLLLALSLLFLAGTLYSGWSQLQPHLSEIDLRYLLAGQLCTLVSSMLGAFLWVSMQKSFQFGFDWRQGLAIHYLSNATKYIPGYGWQYLSKAYLCRSGSHSTRTTSTAILTEFVLLISGGVVLATFTASAYGARWTFDWPVPAWLWFSGGVLTCLGTIIWVLFIDQWLLGPKGGLEDCAIEGDNDRGNRVLSVDRSWLFYGWLIGLCGWFFYGLAIWLFARSLYPVSFMVLPQSLFALVGAGIISVIVVFVPGGFGVREATLALLLTGATPLAVGAVVAVLARVAIIICELIGAMSAIKIGKSLPDLAQTIYPIWGNRG